MYVNKVGNISHKVGQDPFKNDEEKVEPVLGGEGAESYQTKKFKFVSLSY